MNKYNIKRHKKAKKFLKKNEDDKDLILRINIVIYEISKNPYDSKYKQLKSSKCPKCKRAKVGNYRIVFHITKQKKIVEIIDIFHRNDDYQKY